MKNLTLRQVLMILGLTVGSASLMQAYNSTNKYADKETKKHATCQKPNQNSSESGKQEMKSIERRLNKIKNQFDKNHDADAANSALHTMEERIKVAVAAMKQREEHGKMWKTHENTLHRKLRNIREYVKKHSKEA